MEFVDALQQEFLLKIVKLQLFNLEIYLWHIRHLCEIFDLNKMLCILCMNLESQ